MGTNCAPKFANLFLICKERFIRNKNLLPNFYKRYLDDILIIGNTAEIDTAYNELSNASQCLKFTKVIGNNSIDFLDLTLFKGKRFKNNNLIDIKLFSKDPHPIDK